jgi:5-methylcytosine-specific restriction protein A
LFPARRLRRYTLEQFIVEATEQEIKRERDKSRELRRSRWWQNRLALGVCHWCHGQFPPEEMTMDHVIPLARGGKASRSNVVPSCKECNSRKKYLLPMEWEDYLNNIGKTE